MNKKEGFTLVELLAVIVILFIILIIAVPKVLSTIENARQTAFKKGANLIVQSVKLEYSQKLYGTDFDKKLYEFDKKEKSGYKSGSNKLSIKGDKPSIGSVLLNEDGKVAMAIVSNDGRYCATKTYEESEASIKKYVKGECHINTDNIVLGEINEYTITFNDDGRNTQVKVKHGDKITAISSLGKENYSFKYWSPSKSGKEYNFDTKVTNDMTLYAVYEALYKYTNPNIVSAYKYDETNGSADYCVTGVEQTCKQISLVNKGTYNAGTIVNYKVNNNDIVRFHVMFDDGNTLTMQSQTNTIRNTKWYSEDDITKGPLTALSALESATSNWTNVNNQTYTMGSTTFKTNSYTGCMYQGYCSGNAYTLGARTAKARMITTQELYELGNTTPGGDPSNKWVSNYIYGAENFVEIGDSTIDSVTGSPNLGYWTMNAYYSGNIYESYKCVYFVQAGGGVYCGTGMDTSEYGAISIRYGARAVVVINK